MKNLQPTTYPFDKLRVLSSTLRDEPSGSDSNESLSKDNLQLFQKPGFWKVLLLVVSGWLLVAPFSALASNHLTDQPGIDLTIQDVFRIIMELTCWISRTALVLIVVAVIYYGIKFLMAQNDPGKLTSARNSFLWGLVGITVILGTYTIIATIANALGADYTLFIPLSCTSIP